MAKKKSIHSNVGKRYIKSYSKEKGYEYYKDKAAKDKAVSKANKKSTYSSLRKKVPGHEWKKYTPPSKGKLALKKVVAKRTVGKALGRAIPGAAAVLTAAEIVKMVKNRKAKPIKGKSCGPGKTKVTTGGKTYCVSGKKKFKVGKPARDPISKR